jgi:MFS family permease
LEINNAKLGLKKTGNNLHFDHCKCLRGGMIEWKEPLFQSLPRLNLVSLQNSHSVLIVAFGITKAVSNYFAGKLANRYGRKICFIWMVLALLSHLF